MDRLLQHQALILMICFLCQPPVAAALDRKSKAPAFSPAVPAGTSPSPAFPAKQSEETHKLKVRKHFPRYRVRWQAKKIQKEVYEELQKELKQEEDQTPPAQNSPDQ